MPSRTPPPPGPRPGCGGGSAAGRQGAGARRGPHMARSPPDPSPASRGCARSAAGVRGGRGGGGRHGRGGEGLAPWAADEGIQRQEGQEPSRCRFGRRCASDVLAGSRAIGRAGVGRPAWPRSDNWVLASLLWSAARRVALTGACTPHLRGMGPRWRGFARLVRAHPLSGGWGLALVPRQRGCVFCGRMRAFLVWWGLRCFRDGAFPQRLQFRQFLALPAGQDERLQYFLAENPSPLSASQRAVWEALAQLGIRAVFFAMRQKGMFPLDPSGRRPSDSDHEPRSRVTTTFLRRRGFPGMRPRTCSSIPRGRSGYG